MRTLALVALLSTAAAAETTVPVDEAAHRPPAFGTLRFGEASGGVTIRDLDVTLRSGPADVRADATFTLATTSKVMQDSLLVLDVPKGAQVTFLGMTVGGARRVATLVDAVDAQASYNDIVHHQDDPALLEWVGSTETSERLRLRVYPMQRGQTAHMEVILTMPAQRKLVISPGPRAIPRARVELDGARAFAGPLAEARTLALPEAAVGAAPVAAVHVDQARSLFIDQPPPPRETDDLVEELPPVRKLSIAQRRAEAVIPAECLANALAPSCM